MPDEIKENIDKKLYGENLFGNAQTPTAKNILTARFGIVPFSVFNAREGDWQDRKRAWLRVGIQSEIGRGDNLLKYSETCQLEKRNYARSYDQESLNALGGAIFSSGTSVFDPVLCEAMYRWYCRTGAQVIDPFAGGSVRGIVAACLGMKYWGCDLSNDQVEANIMQGIEIIPENLPTWVVGDSMLELSSAPAADFMLSCPPYGDLERYSDDPRDLSTMQWAEFVAAYRQIIQRAALKLRDNRFACFVVGDFRDKQGFYRDFVSQTVDAFRLAGLLLYNEAILVTAVGTAALRATKQFNGSRKLCKVHQNVLVFCKGSWKDAAMWLNEEEKP